MLHVSGVSIEACASNSNRELAQDLMLIVFAIALGLALPLARSTGARLEVGLLYAEDEDKTEEFDESSPRDIYRT